MNVGFLNHWGINTSLIRIKWDRFNSKEVERNTLDPLINKMSVPLYLTRLHSMFDTTLTVYSGGESMLAHSCWKHWPTLSPTEVGRGPTSAATYASGPPLDHHCKTRLGRHWPNAFGKYILITRPCLHPSNRVALLRTYYILKHKILHPSISWYLITLVIYKVLF